MKLQVKVMLIMTATWLAICAIVFVDTKFIITYEYRTLEKRVIRHRILDTQRAFNRMLYSLALYTVAWSEWDGTYHFMKDKNEAYINSNIISATYKSSQLNFILFFDATPKFYYGKFYNAADNEFEPIPQSLLDSLNKNKSFLMHKTNHSSKVGILQSEQGLIVMCSRPIVQSNGEGPIRGSLLMGYYLNDTFYNTLSQIVGMKMAFYPMATVLKDKQLDAGYESIKSGYQYAEVLVSPTIEYGYFLLKDIDNEPVGLIRIEIPRMIYQQGILTAYHYFSIVLLSGIIVILLVWYVLRRFVLDRVVSISNQVLDINRKNQYDHKITVSGTDELSNLVFTINSMLSMIDNSQRQLRYLATHDVLTQLPNREHFYELLNQAIVKSRETNTKVAIMFLDMDKLKTINDNYGHLIGDKLIKSAADRIKKLLRSSDVLARQSGDEFILFMPDISDICLVTNTAERILQETSIPFTIDNIKITISFSIGISLYPDDSTVVEDLIKHADDIMYLAKMKSGNNYRYYRGGVDLQNLDEDK